MEHEEEAEGKEKRGGGGGRQGDEEEEEEGEAAGRTAPGGFAQGKRKGKTRITMRRKGKERDDEGERKRERKEEGGRSRRRGRPAEVRAYEGLPGTGKYSAPSCLGMLATRSVGPSLRPDANWLPLTTFLGPPSICRKTDLLTERNFAALLQYDP